jgi:hypothetical protein
MRLSLRPFPRHPIDRPARDHAAWVVTSLLDRSLAWDGVPAALGVYAGADRGVEVVHAELRSVAAETGTAREDDPELAAILSRTLHFLRSELGYRWHDRGPVEIVGVYLGGAALAWVFVGFAGLALQFNHELVIAGALLATLLMVLLALAMGVSLLKRIMWRYAARVEGADHRVWPFFTPDEYLAARERTLGP